MKTPTHVSDDAGDRQRLDGAYHRLRSARFGAAMGLVALAMVLGSCGSLPAAVGSDPDQLEAPSVSPPVMEANPEPRATVAGSPTAASVDPELESMEDGQFWDIIDRSLDASDGDVERQAEELERILSPLPSAQVASFNAAFVSKNLKLYTWDLWGAAYVLNGGCSDDCFEYFRSWVVGQGRDYYEAVQQDPQVLGDGRLSFALETDDAEWFSYAAEDAYVRASGGRDLHRDYPQSPSTIAGGAPSGTAWDEEDVEKLYPGLAPLP